MLFYRLLNNELWKLVTLVSIHATDRPCLLMAFNIILNTSLAQYSESVMAEIDIEDGMIRRLENNVAIEMVLT